MAIVKGVWVFSETITKIPVSEDVNFSVTLSDGSIINYDLMFISNRDLGYKQAGQAGVTCAYYHSLSPNRWTNENWRTVDFGETEQTVSDEFYTWFTANAVQQGSDPSEPETNTIYTVNSSSLTTVANAIRGKTGTTGELIFPDGYVSAIEDISSVSDLSNAKDIAFGGNESGNKYVIEDETITPLFDQIQRVTKTEEALTFEEATASLLNVVPGGGLPNAEESSFGVTSDNIEYAIKEFKNGTSWPSGETIGWCFKAAEALSILGIRHQEALARNKTFKLWNSNGDSVASVYGSDDSSGDWVSIYFDTPVNVAIGEVYTVSMHSSYGKMKTASSMTISNKLTNIKKAHSGTNNTFPQGQLVASYGLIDLILGSVAMELPDTYNIQRTTMDNIASEVQRISGTTGKMTVSQILTTLQSIQLQDKSVTPTAEVQTITPDDGYYGLSSVTVGAITEENEAVTEIVNEKMEVVANDTY